MSPDKKIFPAIVIPARIVQTIYNCRAIHTLDPLLLIVKCPFNKIKIFVMALEKSFRLIYSNTHLNSRETVPLTFCNRASSLCNTFVFLPTSSPRCFISKTTGDTYIQYYKIKLQMCLVLCRYAYIYYILHMLIYKEQNILYSTYRCIPIYW